MAFPPRYALRPPCDRGCKGHWTSGCLILLSPRVSKERGRLSGALTDDNSAGLSGWRVLSLSERGLGVMGPPSRPSLRCKWVQIPAPTAASPALGKGLPEITGKDGCAAESLKQVGAQKGM